MASSRASNSSTSTSATTSTSAAASATPISASSPVASSGLSLRALAQFFVRTPMLWVTLLCAIPIAWCWNLQPWGSRRWAFNPTVGQLVVVVLVIVSVTASLHEMVQDLRHGHVGVDVLAVVAMLSTLAVREYWAAWAVVLMVWSGDAIEQFAQGKAEGNLTALVGAAPQIAHVGGDDVPVENVKLGDELSVLPGETVPVDGVMLSASATLDMSNINGEPVPRQVRQGAKVVSGSVNGATVFAMQTTSLAQDSQYQRILELVSSARESRAPVVKTADMLAVPFTVLSFVIAGLAWLVSGVPERFAQVLVLATPCPLLIAAPVAYMAGTSRLAKAGILIKAQEVLENLGRVTHVFFDKTGTVTGKRPQVIRVETAKGAVQSKAFEAFKHSRGHESDLVLALSGILESNSVHILAQGIAKAGDAAIARLRKAHVCSPDLGVNRASAVREDSGGGVSGIVAGVKVSVGKLDYVAGAVDDFAGRGIDVVARRGSVRSDEADPTSVPSRFAPLGAGEMEAFVAFDGLLIARIVLRDVPRSNAKSAMVQLRELGVASISMVTGDKCDSAQAIAEEVGIDDVHAQMLPKDKLDVVRQAQHDTVSAYPWWDRVAAVFTGESLTRPITMMVGDGVNDAPVLAAADIGVAMTDGSSTAASQSAQVVIMNDNIELVPQAVRVARHTKQVMLQAVLGGLSLAVVGMLAASFNLIPAVVGAFMQEGIDVISILWALSTAVERKR